MKTVVQQISILLQARDNCAKSGNTEWFLRHTAELLGIVEERLPSGSGVDNGTEIDLELSCNDRGALYFPFGFHHMDQNGVYCGWTKHTAIVLPSFSGFDLMIVTYGRAIGDRRMHHDYLRGLYRRALGQSL